MRAQCDYFVRDDGCVEFVLCQAKIFCGGLRPLPTGRSLRRSAADVLHVACRTMFTGVKDFWEQGVTQSVYSVCYSNELRYGTGGTNVPYWYGTVPVRYGTYRTCLQSSLAVPPVEPFSHKHASRARGPLHTLFLCSSPYTIQTNADERHRMWTSSQGTNEASVRYRYRYVRTPQIPVLSNVTP